MPQAIICKHLPCTRTKPRRWVVSGSGPGAPRRMYSVDYWTAPMAASAYAIDLKWKGKWCAQELPTGWIFIADPVESFTVRP